MNKRRRWKAKARRKYGWKPLFDALDRIAASMNNAAQKLNDIGSVIKSLHRAEPLCEHDNVTRSLEEGCVRLTCTDCGLTMFMSEELEASL